MNTISSLTLDSHAICNPQRSISLRQVRPTTRNVVVCSAKPVAPPPTKLAAADTSGSRIGALSQVSGVLGCQWGDEGKGKLVDILAQHFEIVARCQVLPKFSSFSIFMAFVFVSNRGLFGKSMELVCVCVCVCVSECFGGSVVLRLIALRFNWISVFCLFVFFFFKVFDILIYYEKNTRLNLELGGLSILCLRLQRCRFCFFHYRK